MGYKQDKTIKKTNGKKMVNKLFYKADNNVGACVDRIMVSLILFIIIYSILDVFIKIIILKIFIYVPLGVLCILLGTFIANKVKWHYTTNN